MGIDDAKSGRLEPQMREHTAEDGVLMHVGEVTGMVGVAVVHGRSRRRRASDVACRRELPTIYKVLATGFANW
jgi:hypothetical protein